MRGRARFTPPAALAPAALVLGLLLASAVQAQDSGEGDTSCNVGLVCFTTWWKHGPKVALPWISVFTCSPFALISTIVAVAGRQAVHAC